MQGLAFWLAVGLVAVASVLIFKLVGSKIPYQPIKTLAAAV